MATKKGKGEKEQKEEATEEKKRMEGGEEGRTVHTRGAWDQAPP
jgi:hypothetical protein